MNRITSPLRAACGRTRAGRRVRRELWPGSSATTRSEGPTSFDVREADFVIIEDRRVMRTDLSHDLDRVMNFLDHDVEVASRLFVARLDVTLRLLVVRLDD